MIDPALSRQCRKDFKYHHVHLVAAGTASLDFIYLFVFYLFIFLRSRCAFYGQAMHFFSVSDLFRFFSPTKFIPPRHTFQRTSCNSLLLPSFIYTFVTELWLLFEVGIMDKQALPKY